MPYDQNNPHRVLRGGCWRLDRICARLMNHSWDAPGDRDISVGARLHRVITPMQQIAEATELK